jgi:hypothetical protein
MAYVPARGLGFTPEQETSLLAGQASLLDEMRRARELADREAKNRRLALYIAAGGALFAALRLGILAIPKLRRAEQQP